MTTIKISNGSFELSVEQDDFSPPWIPDKTPLLLQHGFGRVAEVWTTWVPHVSEFYPVLRPTLRGLRSKPAGFKPSDLSLDSYLSDLCRILDELAIEKVHFCGESFGGSLGIAFASRHPDRVKTLSVIASPVFLNRQWHENYSMGHGSWSNAMRTMGVHAWLDETNRSTRFPKGTGSAIVDWYKSLVEGADEEVLLAMAELIETSDMRPFLGGIEAPTLLLAPEGGGIITEEQLSAYRAGVKDLKVLLFRTDFHKIQLLKAAQCAQHVVQFCSLIDGRALTDF
ncbi:3-oxoadipate enol-lactonase [Pigmentiphaga soli]|uniref:3-oxoadipate enol-lactonase n=1 Tax=Pigmentiphaga soli TaxID=1007095 RepID=A0ABP8H7T6_9BURK